tara:strand:- start:830 stop:1036 length:207 start_codon:yes stop_codon:yes gene_type:complete
MQASAWIGLAVALTFALVDWISAGRIARPFADLNLRLDKALDAADKRLYQAKQKGRDCVVAASDTSAI